MRLILRGAAIAIAIAGVVDPAVARRVQTPLSVEFRLPPASHPDFERAESLRHRAMGALDLSAIFDGRIPPHAIVAVGDADVGDVDGARVFSMPLPSRAPATSITKVQVPRRTASGQSVSVGASVRALGAAGRASSITLGLGGMVVAATSHQWTADDERFDARLAFVPPGAGVHRIRIDVSTEQVAGRSVADAIVVVGDDPLRVLVYEPRPSWPVAFVRRSLESDALFHVASSSRSSRPAATLSAGAPASLSTLDTARYDALIVGALDELRDADLSAIDRFVTERGGTAILVPDRQVPARVLRRFDLPEFEETLLERPVDVQGDGVSMKGSELLLAPPSAHELQPLGTLQQGNTDRVAIATVVRGAGRIIVSGVLDAWRYRAGTPNEFEASWRGLVADASLDAPPRVEVRVDPAIARPRDTVTISVGVRPTELMRNGETVSLPPVSAWLIAEDGRRQPVRLWPAAALGSFEAVLRAPVAGRFTVSASIPGAATEIPLLVADDVVHAHPGESGAPAHAARATGGAIVTDGRELSRGLAAIDPGSDDELTRPMRSAWWIVPFALLLCGEWALRRRSGSR